MEPDRQVSGNGSQSVAVRVADSPPGGRHGLAPDSIVPTKWNQPP
jgi:hypothetical protein